MQVLSLRKSNDDNSKIKAFFDLQTDEGFIITGMKIIAGRNGLFVSPPSRKTDDKWVDIVTYSSDATKETLTALALRTYNGESGSESVSREKVADEYDW